MNTKQIFGVIVSVLVGVGLGYLFFHSVPQTVVVQGVSAVGTTFNSAKVASVIMAPATAAATSTSILNPDSSDRIVTNSFAACNTVGGSLPFLTGLTSGSLPNWGLKMATTSTAAQTGSVNLVSNLNISTTTPWSYTASSTVPFPGPVTNVWPAGTYLTLTFNATNTATCVAGVNYLAS